MIRYIERIKLQEKQENSRQIGLMLIFCSKIKTIVFLNDFLKRNNITNYSILHGKLPQQSREKILNEFRAGKITILISSDVAARGIHIKQLKYVINYDFPSNLESYCHRVGRTGRQGQKGYSYSLITRNLAPLTKDLISLLNSCNQTPEPNLIKLCDEYNSGMISPDEIFIENEDEN